MAPLPGLLSRCRWWLAVGRAGLRGWVGVRTEASLGKVGFEGTCRGGRGRDLGVWGV